MSTISCDESKDNFPVPFSLSIFFAVVIIPYFAPYEYCYPSLSSISTLISYNFGPTKSVLLENFHYATYYEVMNHVMNI